MQLSLAETLQALRERWWVLLAAAAAAATAAFLFTRLPWVEPEWKSSVWLQANGRFEYGNSLALERELRPLAEGILQLSVMRDVDRNLHLDIPAEKLLSNVKAEPVQDSDQVRIDYSDTDPGRAERTALEIANVYTQQYNASQQGKVREEQVLLSVLDRPGTARLDWPQTPVLVPAAAILGLVLAAAIVAILASLDDTLKSAEDVERYLGLPLLGRIPRHAGTRATGRRLALPARSPSALPTAAAEALSGRR